MKLSSYVTSLTMSCQQTLYSLVSYRLQMSIGNLLHIQFSSILKYLNICSVYCVQIEHTTLFNFICNDIELG